MKFPWAILHRKCGNTAFYYKGPIGYGVVVIADNVQYLDGSTPEALTLPVCGSCGEVFGEPPAVEDVIQRGQDL